MLGALAEITLVYDDGNVYIKEYKATPVVTHITKGQKSFQTYLLKDYPDDLASQHKLSLSFDHRLIDGGTAQRAMNRLKELLADPELLLMEG